MNQSDLVVEALATTSVGAEVADRLFPENTDEHLMNMASAIIELQYKNLEANIQESDVKEKAIAALDSIKGESSFVFLSLISNAILFGMGMGKAGAKTKRKHNHH